MQHEHDHPVPNTSDAKIRRKLVVSTALTLVFVGVELTAGLYANSLAMIGDAFHNLTDSLALVLAFLAVVLQRRPPTASKTYGYQRAGILAAFVNAAMLVGFTLVIFVEAWERFRNPVEVNPGVMIWVSLLALGVNTGIALWLRAESRSDLNIRSAVLHQVGDALSSVGVIVAAILIRWTGYSIIDPVLSILIGIAVIWSSWGILRETLNLLLDGTPQGIDADEVGQALFSEQGVIGIHHLHIWALGPNSPALSCHLLMGDVPLKTTSEVVGRVNTMLRERYGIVHTTIQFEHANCAEEEDHCSPGQEGAN